VWKRADDAGFYWISVWDHFYANPLRDRGDPCFEGVASMAALAALTSRVRVGCLVFCSLFRSPGMMAKAVEGLKALKSRGIGYPIMYLGPLCDPSPVLMQIYPEWWDRR